MTETVRPEDVVQRSQETAVTDPKVSRRSPQLSVTLLTGGGDKPYAFGLTTELMAKGVALDVIGSDELDCPEFHGTPGVNFINLRGDQRPGVSVVRKVQRLSRYYSKLLRYAATAKPKIFHILWNNKLEWFDRTLLMLYYKTLGKKIVLTVHNVNARKRDSRDSALNRLTLRVQYRLCDHIFVHTEKMKRELIGQFAVLVSRVSVIPFGINNAVPNTALTEAEARRLLALPSGKKTILFFGNITPYKGLEFLVDAFQKIALEDNAYQLIIAGRLKNCEDYWAAIRQRIDVLLKSGRILLRTDFIPDEKIEIYFKAADAVVLPYRYIDQSGVLFLAYSFGLPVLAADVGCLKEEIIKGRTGFVFKPEDPVDLASAIEKYFASDLYLDLNRRRQEIRNFATERHSWELVGQSTVSRYSELLQIPFSGDSSTRDASRTYLDVKTPS